MYHGNTLVGTTEFHFFILAHNTTQYSSRTQHEKCCVDNNNVKITFLYITFFLYKNYIFLHTTLQQTVHMCVHYICVYITCVLYMYSVPHIFFYIIIKSSTHFLLVLDTCTTTPEGYNIFYAQFLYFVVNISIIVLNIVIVL